MKLTKDGEIIELMSEKHANKFKEYGWKEVREDKPKAKTEKKAKK